MVDADRPEDSEGLTPPTLRVVSRNDNIGPARPPFAPRKPSATNIYSSIGECVAQCRESRGLSQKELAFALGVDVAILRKCESGELVFTPNLLLKAAATLELKVSNFFMILAKKRLADLIAYRIDIDPDVSIADDADKIRVSLFDAMDRCDSLLTILDIIDVSAQR